MTGWASAELNRLAGRVGAKWVRANNEGSGKPEHYRRLMGESEAARDQHDALAGRNGLRVMWPGLDPHYVKVIR